MHPNVKLEIPIYCRASKGSRPMNPTNAILVCVYKKKGKATS